MSILLLGNSFAQMFCYLNVLIQSNRIVKALRQAWRNCDPTTDTGVAFRDLVCCEEGYGDATALALALNDKFLGVQMCDEIMVAMERSPEQITDVGLCEIS